MTKQTRLGLNIGMMIDEGMMTTIDLTEIDMMIIEEMIDLRMIDEMITTGKIVIEIIHKGMTGGHTRVINIMKIEEV